MPPMSLSFDSWFEEVENTPDHPYSYAWIEWHHSSKSFKYKGINFNQNLTVNARWSSSTIIANKSAEKIEFLFDATVISNGQRVEGYGTLEFFTPIGGCYQGGRGSFVDSGIKSKKYTLKMKRIDDAFVREILDHKAVRDEDDVIRVITNLLKQRGISQD